MEDEEVAKYWEGNAEAWTYCSRAGYDVFRDALNTPSFLAMLPPVDGLTGIDIGCGEGYNTRKVAELGAKMTAIDLAPTFIRYASEQEQANPLGITYQVANAHALPFDNDCFDFSIACMSLMDMPDQAAVFQEIYRVLKPG
jgi:ubiquinone/menaquinone biosynthesis C-methylase UbiE